LARLPDGVDPSFFAKVASSSALTSKTAAAPAESRAAQWRALPESQRRGAVHQHVAELAFSVIGLNPATVIESHTPLKEVGLDSLMAVELRNALTRSLGELLPATLLFDHPSLDALTDHLMRRLNLSSAPTSLSSAVAEIVALTDAEAEAQLLAELSSLDSESAS
jgi:hypothetical protein